MESVVLKWRYRGCLKAATNWKYKSSLKNLYKKIGFKFKKLKDYILVRNNFSELKETGIDVQSLKLNTITMKDGLCFLCSDGNYNSRKVDRIETYAYATYTKNSSNSYIPKLINLF